MEISVNVAKHLVAIFGLTKQGIGIACRLGVKTKLGIYARMSYVRYTR